MSATINPAWLASFGSECWYCGTTLTPETASVDHRTPRCRGGEGKGNLVPACHRCNCMKKDKTEEEFFLYKPCFRQRRRFLPLSVFPIPGKLSPDKRNLSTALLHRRTNHGNPHCPSCGGTGVRPSWFAPRQSVHCHCRSGQRNQNTAGFSSVTAARRAEFLPLRAGMLGRAALLEREAAFRKAVKRLLLVQREQDEAAYLRALQVVTKLRRYLYPATFEGEEQYR